MQTITLVSLLLIVAIAMLHGVESKMFTNNDLMQELELELELEEDLQALSRARRSLQCGKKFLKFLMSNCPAGCTSTSNVNLATKCCASSCGDDYIRSECCPS